MTGMRCHTAEGIYDVKTFTIELRVSYDTSEQDEIIKNAARQAAKHLYATAILLSDKRKPQIALYTSDFIEGAAELELADDLPTDEDEVFRVNAEEVDLAVTTVTDLDPEQEAYFTKVDLEDKEDNK